MSDDLVDLYQDIILDHNRRPRNSRKIHAATHQSEGINPLCGDEVTIYLDLLDERIIDISFQGQGCAISQASASLMTEMLKGLDLDETRQHSKILHDLLNSEEDAQDALLKYGNLAALSEYASSCAYQMCHLGLACTGSGTKRQRFNLY